MANAEQLERLTQGVEGWNQWRENNPDVNPDLSNAELFEAYLVWADLRNADLRKADLLRADLRGAYLFEAHLSGADLSGADLSGAHLSGAHLSGAYLSKANLSGADLRQADLRIAHLRRSDLRGSHLGDANLARADLREADLCKADLRDANFRKTNLGGADLSEVDLRDADLSGADLSGANLGKVNFSRTQALGANFKRAIFTGACLEDWNINNATRFDDAVCSFVYLKAKQQDRRPREGLFKPGEFAALFQQAVDTVDLIFKDGIDWQAFFQSFQDLRSQYADQDLSIQAIEKKRGGTFVVRLEVAEGADKSSIEGDAKRLYESQLAALEAQYEKQLRLKGEQHSYEIKHLIEAERQEKATLMGVLTTMANNQGPKNDFRGAQFGGGFIETNQGTQYGGTINNYGSNAEDITRLLTALRDQAQAFPAEQKDDANDTLDLLERDLAEEQPDQGRIGRRLKKLLTLAAAIGTIASGAAAVSGDVSTFTGNVIELTEQLGIPIEQVQLPLSGTP